MVFVLIAFAIVFVLRVGYMARAKGFSVFGYSLATLLVCAAAAYAGVMVVGGSTISDVGIAGGAVGILLGGAFMWWHLWDREAKEGSPGNTYLQISLTCPECNKEIAFHRSRRGLMQDCPECGELVRVPFGDDKDEKPKIVKPEGKAHDWVVLRGYTHDFQAELGRDVLQNAGIEANVSRDDAGGMLTFLQESTGVRLMVRLRDWDKAMELIEETEKNA